MATDKKKTDHKTDKKSGTKAALKTTKSTAASAQKTLSKATKKGGKGKRLVIKVPRGGQVIEYFTLTPALPSTTAAGDWIFASRGSKDDISHLTVRFQVNPSALERQFERAILVVSMQENPATKGTWRFALGGVATPDGDQDPNNDVSVEIIDNGFTLLIYVQVLENSDALVPFQFVASHTDDTTGVVNIYESRDPTIQPRRP